ncbi:MAG: phenylalanine--tRNA ligase subunit alpha, partial [Oscillospiraceae bacterium]
MKELLQKLKEGSLSDILGAESLEVLDSLKVKYLGKKGELTAILKQMGKLDETQRPIIGQLANEVREDITQGLENKRIALAEKQLERRLRSETIDVTIPGKPVSVGKKHPLNTVLDEAADIFLG